MGFHNAKTSMSTEPPYDEIDTHILTMGRIAAARVNAQTLAAFRNDIEHQREAVGDQPYYREWLQRIDDGPNAVAALFVDESQHGRYMRAVAPLRASVTREERDDIFQRDQVPPDQRWRSDAS
jgi:hypothetical protein